MRTSLEIPDPLFRLAKRVALDRETTLKALITTALEKELNVSSTNLTHRLLSPPIKLPPDSPLRSNPDSQIVSADQQEATDLDAVYRRR